MFGAWYTEKIVSLKVTFISYILDLNNPYNKVYNQIISGLHTSISS